MFHDLMMVIGIGVLIALTVFAFIWPLLLADRSEWKEVDWKMIGIFVGALVIGTTLVGALAIKFNVPYYYFLVGGVVFMFGGRMIDSWRSNSKTQSSGS